MKKLSLAIVIIFVCIVLLNGYSAKASFQKYKPNEVDHKLLQALITKRTEIMNKGLYNCDNIDKIIEELKAIEKGTILETDILSLKEAYSNPTDYPMVNDVMIKDIMNVDFNENIYEIISNIEWNISYNLEEITEEYQYIIQIEHQDEKYLLVEFRLQE